MSSTKVNLPWAMQRRRIKTRTARQVSPLASEAGPSRLLPPGSHRVLGVVLLLHLAIGIYTLGDVAVCHRFVFVLELSVVVVVLVLTLRHDT